MQPYKSYHTTVNYRLWAGLAGSASVAYLSVPTVSTNSSAAYQYRINNTTTILTKSVLTINITNIDWPCRQCLGRLYVSQSVLPSVWQEKSSGAVAWIATLILTRLAWQAFVSVVYVSGHYQSVWIQ